MDLKPANNNNYNNDNQNPPIQTIPLYEPGTNQQPPQNNFQQQQPFQQPPPYFYPQNIAQGIPMQQNQQAVYYNQQPMQQQQQGPGMQILMPQQQGGVMMVQVDNGTLRLAQLRDLAIKFKKINECWAILIFILLFMYVIKLIMQEVSTMSYIGISLVIVEYVLWFQASLDGKYVMERQQFFKLKRMVKLTYASVPFQVIGHGLLIADDIQNGVALLIVIQAMIEIYIVYYKIYKLAKCAQEVEKYIEAYNREIQGTNEPSAEEALKVIFNLQAPNSFV